jgi:predicted glycogen debranching enzyme
VAAEAFCADACPHPAVIAGYPWYDVESRDLLISFPGLYLVRGRVEQAKRVLETVINAMRDGYVPKRIRNDAKAQHVSAADASLWLFEAARLLATVVGASDDFVREELYPALVKIFERVRSRRQGILWVTRDGLIANGDSELPLTWMDARIGDQPTTPRHGLAVELQALWSRGCATLAALARHYGEPTTERAAETASSAARQAFRRRFWCTRTKYPYDCIRTDADENGTHADATIRPNGLIALDVEPELFERWQALAIVTKVRERLLTPRGIRTLDPDDPAYRGAYMGDYFQRRTADHQGMAWTYLLGTYARAALRLSPDDFELQEDLREIIEEARRGNPVLGQVPQLSDGEPPHRPGGCPAQAWSVAELLRTLVWDLRA